MIMIIIVIIHFKRIWTFIMDLMIMKIIKQQKKHTQTNSEINKTLMMMIYIETTTTTTKIKWHGKSIITDD